MCRMKLRDHTCSGILGLCYIVTCCCLRLFPYKCCFIYDSCYCNDHTLGVYTLLHTCWRTNYVPLWSATLNSPRSQSRWEIPSKKAPKTALIQWERSRVWCGNPGVCMCVWSRAVRKNAWNDGILFLAGDESRAFSLVEVKGMRSAYIMLIRERRHRVLATGTTWRGSPQTHKNTLKNIFRKVYWHFLRNIEYEWIQSLVSCLDCK